MTLIPYSTEEKRKRKNYRIKADKILDKISDQLNEWVCCLLSVAWKYFLITGKIWDKFITTNKKKYHTPIERAFKQAERNRFILVTKNYFSSCYGQEFMFTTGYTKYKI